MKTRRIDWLLVLLFVGIALTALPAAAQDIPALPLTTTFTSSNGSLSFQHPEGWVTGESGPAVALATHEPFLSPGTPLESGELRADIFAGPINSLAGLDDTASLDDVMSLATRFDTADDCEAFSTPIEVTIDGHAGLQSGQVCGSLEYLLLILELDAGAIGIIGAMTPPGAMSDFTSTILAISGTLAYATPETATDTTTTNQPAADGPLVIDTRAIELGQFYRTRSGFITFRYPDEWFVHEDNTQGQTLLVVSPLENLDFNRALNPGESMGIILVGDAAELMSRNMPAGGHERAVATLQALVAPLGIPASEIFPLTLAGRAGAGIEISTPMGDNGQYLLPIGGNVFVIVSIFAPQGELAQAAPTYQAVMNTVSLDMGTGSEASAPETVNEPPDAEVQAPPQVVVPPETLAPAEPVPFSLDLSETFTTASGRFQFQYPAGWTLVPTNGPLILTNVEQLSFVTGEQGAEVAPGNFRIIIGLMLKEDRSLTDLWAENTGTISAGETASFSAGGHEALRGPIDVHLMTGTLAVVDLNADNAAVITIYHSPENSAEVDELLPALIETMQYE